MEGDIYEREPEIAAIRHLLERALDDEGAAMAVSGPMGIGKTRVLEAARSFAEDAGFQVVQGTGGELERDFPFGVVLSLFETLTAKRAAASRRSLFRGRAAAAQELLLAEQPDPSVWAAPSGEFALLHGLYWFSANLSEELPLAIIVDDLHWADAPSLRYLLYLAQRLAGLPIALFVAIRSGEPASNQELLHRLLDADRMHEAKLRPLSRSAVMNMLGSETEQSPLAHSGWEATGGNPWLVGALRQAIERGDAAEVGAPGALAPQSVRRALVLQVERLGHEAVALSQAAAVLGPVAQYRTMAGVAALDETAAGHALGRLEAADVLVGTDEVRFSHPMYRTALYGALEPGERARLHAAAAEILHNDGASDDPVAHHLLLGASVRGSWASETLHRAARLTAQRGSPDAAVRMLRRALEIDPASDRRGDMLLDLGIVEAAAGEQLSLRHITEAAESFASDRKHADALCALGKTLYRYGRFDEAAATLERGLALAGRVEDVQYGLEYEASYLCAAMYVPDLQPQVYDRVDRVVAPILARETKWDEERPLLAIAALQFAFDGTPADRIVDIAHRALGDGALLRHGTSEGMLLYMAIEALFYAGRLREATAAIDEALADARRTGSVLALGEASQLRALIHRGRGALAEATADAQAAIAGREFGYAHGAGVPYAVLAECLMDRGDLAAAEQVLDEVERHPEPLTTSLQAWPLAARGRLLLDQGRAPEALERLRAAGRVLTHYGIVNPALLPWRSRAALAAHLAERPDEALSMAEEELRLARAFGADVWTARALRAWSRVVGGGDGIRGLLEAASLLEGSGAELEYARTLVELGRAQRRGGQRATAREHLRHGQELAHRCGADSLAALARDELRAAGARPRREAVAGVNALTPSELRVVQLAAAGQSNRAIAQELFVTKNTVDWHLRNAFHKLDVHSRNDLAELLAGHGMAAEPGDDGR